MGGWSVTLEGGNPKKASPLLVGVLLTIVGVGAVPVTVTVSTRLRTVGVHAGGVEAGLGGVRVGVVALLSVVAIFVAVRAPLGVRGAGARP